MLKSAQIARFAPALCIIAGVACTSTDRSATSAPGADEFLREPVEPRAWEHESSDLAVDERIHFGHFANGMRWAWANNPEPKDRLYLRLHVNIGSLAERDDEVGMAHFLEHMAFNGSTNFEAGTLIEWFQQNGMAFGPDTNASTGFSETIYQLDLAESDEETLREGLLVLRDYASELTLAEEEVEAEKGVIDGEERERDSAGFRLLKQQLEIMFDGTRVQNRLPIGTPEVRAQFTAQSVRAFYERWYRPEHMTLVAVGDLGDLNPEDLFAEYFADFRAPATPLTHEPPVGRAASLARSFAIYEEEIPSVDLALNRFEHWEEEPDTIATRLDDLPLSYAHRILNLRFYEAAKREDAPFLSASVSSAAILNVFDGESLNISCPPEKWKEALAFCEQELRKALEFGFQQAELDEIRADALRSLDEAVERESTAHSGALLGALLTAAENRFVPTNASTRRAYAKPAIEALTVEACHAALKEAWSKGELSIQATGNLDLGEDAGATLLAALEASRSVAVEADEVIEVNAFAYASSVDKQGAIRKRQSVDDLGFEAVTFENGVRVNVKRTEFKENQVLLSARIGEGRVSAEPAAVAALAWVGTPILNGGGLEAHSEDDLRRLTAGKTAGVAFSIGEGALTLGGPTTAEDLLLQCEIACAYLNAPGWREEGLVQFRRQIPLVFDGLKHQHQGPLLTEFFPTVFDGDLRFALPTQKQAVAVTTEDVQAWIAPQLFEGPIEVSLVGDLDVEETIAICARTFGMLPPRRARREHSEHRVAPSPKSGVNQRHQIETQVPKSLVLIVFPTADGIDTTTRRRLNVLSNVVNDRLRVNVREKLGAAYSPGAGVQLSETYPGVGMLMIQAMADPETVDTLVEACLDVAEDLATNGVTDEEIDRLREPTLARRRDAKRQNGYWMSVLSEAQGDPDHLDEVRSADAFYATHSAADIAPLAEEYLARDKASILVVEPK